MKVNYENVVSKVIISNLNVGDVFLANRTSTPKVGAYMKVDGNSGIIPRRQHRCYAVNLESGQLREFDTHFYVQRVSAETTLGKIK